MAERRVDDRTLPNARAALLATDFPARDHPEVLREATTSAAALRGRAGWP